MSPLFRTVLLVTSAYLLLLSTASAAGPNRYAITQLRHLATATGAYAAASSINDSGVVAGGDFIIEGTTVPMPRYRNALTWSADGTPAALPRPANSPYANALGINNNGLVVGVSDFNTTSGQPRRATFFQGGVATQIVAQQGSNFAFAMSVNDSGAIAGNDSVLPFVYANGVKTMLSPSSTAFAAASSAPVLVSPNGVVYATGKPGFNGNDRPYRLTSAMDRAPLYTDATRYGAAYDVNRSETLVGIASDASGSPARNSAAIFKNGTITLLPGLTGGTYGAALGINDLDTVVGVATTNGLSRGRAFRTIDGVTVNLNSLIDADGRTLAEAVSINNRGQIVGNGLFDDDNDSTTPVIRAAFRLDPIRTAADANYDDAVDFKDLLVLAQNFGESGSGTVFWESGDFNFDWKIDFADLLILAQNYEDSAAFSADYARAVAMVPEPTLAAIAFALCAVAGRRRKC